MVLQGERPIITSPYLSNSKGFSLIELLVVIVVIAILATIAVTVYSGIQKNARDSRRKADIDAIAKAIETKKQTGTDSYGQISGTDFSSKVPEDTTTAKYCIAETTSQNAPSPDNPTSWNNSETCPTGFNVIDGSTYPQAGITAFRICALLENASIPQWYCRGNAQ